LIVKNTLQIKSATLLANEREGSVLPNSTRKFEITWGKPNLDTEEDSSFFDMVGNQWKDFHFGWYRAKLNLVWGVSSQVADASVNFFVFPWQLLLIVFVTLLIVWFLAKIILKKYNRFIIDRATQQK
jgi:hypothetical protein